MKFIRQVFKNPYNWLVLILLTINILPILAPLLLHWGLDYLAKPIYFIYSFTCHQFAHRSIHVYDHQCAWCTRDMAIWGAILTVSLLIKKYKISQGITWYWAVPFIIPIALDGGIQTIATMLNINPSVVNGDPFYISTNMMRAISGAVFGTGLALWLLPPLYDSFLERGFKGFSFRNVPWKVVFISLTTVLMTYVLFVDVWSKTGTEYKPTNVVDFTVRTPNAKEFFLRRENGSCPVNAISNDPLALECFF